MMKRLLNYWKQMENLEEKSMRFQILLLKQSSKRNRSKNNLYLKNLNLKMKATLKDKRQWTRIKKRSRSAKRKLNL